MSARSAERLLASFRALRVAVVGDVMLDEYVRGDVERVSPEAPVPVVECTERQLLPGGAANAAANIVSLGGAAVVVGVIGADGTGDHLKSTLRERGIDTLRLVSVTGRPTTHKLRVVARTQQIVRVDVESRDPLSAPSERELVAQIEQAAAAADALVISDYAKGVVTEGVVRACVASARRHGIPLLVDPKARNLSRYAGATLITPNVRELELAAGVATLNADDAIVDAGSALLPNLGGSAILVTRGAAGMTLLTPGAPPLHLPTRAKFVFDVTGAGDTVVAAVTLSLAARASMHDALLLASHAAGIAVGRPGTVAVSAAEFLEALRGSRE